MDLRMVKTRSQIKEAFLALRQKLMPEKIKVKDICAVAMINKTTFYNHYTDSNELSNEIENYAIEKVMSDFPERDRIFEDPKAYIVGLLRALEKEAENLRIIFRGKQEALCAGLEDRLHKLYSDMPTDADGKILLSFILGGFVRIVKDHLFTSEKCSIDRLAEQTIRLLESILPPNTIQFEGIKQS